MTTKRTKRSDQIPLGQLRFTPGALQAIGATTLLDCLEHHAHGDWGDVHAIDRASNERAVEHGGRLVSRYTTGNDLPFWIITEADRSVTTILLPFEY